MATVLACASMQFSTNSAMALSGLLCERAMIRIAFQSSPIRNLPLSDSFDLVALIFATLSLCLPSPPPAPPRIYAAAVLASLLRCEAQGGGRVAGSAGFCACNTTRPQQPLLPVGPKRVAFGPCTTTDV